MNLANEWKYQIRKNVDQDVLRFQVLVNDGGMVVVEMKHSFGDLLGEYDSRLPFFDGFFVLLGRLE